MLFVLVPVVGCHVKRAVFTAVLLVMLAPEGPLGSVQCSELAEMPTVFVTETVSVSVVPNKMFVSLMGLTTSGPSAWPAERMGMAADRTLSSRIARKQFQRDPHQKCDRRKLTTGGQ